MNTSKRVFIGHGCSALWRDIKDFLVERLHLDYEEFNREPAAGKSTKERLEEMLVASGFALIVMTGEDETPDGRLRATFARFGSKHEFAMRIQKYCDERAGYDDVVALCAAVERPYPLPSDDCDANIEQEENWGFVYLMKSGRCYKLGRTTHVGGRERDLAIQLPEKIITVHSIRTDDPTGIEAYWHNRFDAKRKHGEWFDLSSVEVMAFKRRIAERQFARFLMDAQETRADLVITPEYSMPWEILIAAIKEGTTPAQGKLWVLGCESIKFRKLEALKQELAPFATVLYEPLQPDATRFTDPLAYVFFAPRLDDNTGARLVVLVRGEHR